MAHSCKHITHNWGRVQNTVVEATFTFTIDNFSLLKEEVGDCIESPNFYAGVGGKDKWRLDVYPKAIKKENDHLSIFLRLVETNKEEILVKFKISILDVNGYQVISKEYKVMMDREKINNYGSPKFIHRGQLIKKEAELLPNDILTIYCEISYIDETILSAKKSLEGEEVLFQSTKSSLSKDLESFLESPEHSDFSLTLEGREIPVHKVILAARSPVFRAMFSHGMQEAQQKRTKITDVEYCVLREMMHFIYTGEITHDDQLLLGQLLAAADKYGVEDLKSTCEDAIVIDVENAAEMLALSDLHSAKKLKWKSVDFILKHSTVVRRTDGWKDLAQSNPRCLDDVIQALLESYQGTVYTKFPI